MQSSPRRPQARIVSLWASIAAFVAGCAAPPAPPPAPKPLPPEPVRTPPPPVVTPKEQPAHVSQARTAREYRRDAASHLYAQNTPRIYRGKLPPLLHAVAVVDVEIDHRGHLVAIRWTRKPSHAPEVVTEIERTLRNAAPYPAPVKMGKVTYTDTWLWHKSGLFQLDTLTEGQL